MALPKHLPLETFKPDVRLLHHITYDLTPEQREHKHIVLALTGVNYEDVYRAAGLDGQRGVWQMETYALPWRLRETLARNGFEMLSDEKHYDAGGHVFWFVRFCYPYAADTDWPPAPYYPRPADWPREWPWERPVATPSHDPAYDRAQQPGKLIPVPDCPGLDHSYAQMGMADPTPTITPDPEPPAPARPQTIRYAQRVLPVDSIICTAAGSVFARVNISTTARPMWHHVLIARMTARPQQQEAA